MFFYPTFRCLDALSSAEQYFLRVQFQFYYSKWNEHFSIFDIASTTYVLAKGMPYAAYVFL